MKFDTASNLLNSVNSVISNFKKALSQDIVDNEEVRSLFLKSYNFYQDEEFDGADYIFDITNREDVMNTELEVGEVYDLYNNFIHGKAAKYFLCGYNYPTPVQLEDKEALIRILVGWVDYVARHIIEYPSICDSHKELYQCYIGRCCHE